MPTKDRIRHEYRAEFYDYLEQGALRSARAIVPLVLEGLNPRTVLDVGCGTGVWLSVYREHGVPEVLGVDGEYVPTDRLHVPPGCFTALDVSQPFDLGRRFDLVQCLEVAEHLPPAASRTLVSSLARHGGLILFSAAVPGQGGEHHTNERPYEFWRALLAEQGFAPYDFVRPHVRRDPQVERWYAYNTLLYAHRDASAALPGRVRETRIPDGAAIPDLAPGLFRLRTALLRRLPVPIVTNLAVLKHRLVLARRRSVRS